MDLGPPAFQLLLLWEEFLDRYPQKVTHPAVQGPTEVSLSSGLVPSDAALPYGHTDSQDPP